VNISSNLASFSAGAKRFRIRIASTFALAGMMTIAITAVPTSANAATVVDYSCNQLGEGISACQWLVRSLVQVNGRTDNQFETWAEMKGGKVNREIITVKLQYRAIVGEGAIQIACETGAPPLVGGNGTISAHCANRACNFPAYRPIFQYKYFEPKPANTWVRGWSYGQWYYTLHIKCSTGVTL
jgi:hypothetical protein